MSQVQAIRLYQNEQFIGNCAVQGTINCDLTTGAKQGYLIPGKGLMEFELVFKQPAIGPYISGVFIDENGKYTLLDGTVADFVAKCNACCGEDAVVTPVYNGVFPDLAAAAVLRTVTVQIKDDGSNYANNQGLYKYSKYVWVGWARSSRNNGTGITTYTFQTYKTDVPPLLDPDNTTPDIITYTDTTYDSNVPGALTSGQHYIVAVTVNGNTYGVPTPFLGGADVTLPNVAIAMNANTSYAALGTWTETGGKLRLSSHTLNTVGIVVSKA